MELPPVLQLMISEIPPHKLRADNIRRLLNDKGFIREVSAQAEFSVRKKVTSSAEGSTDELLKMYPTAALNPLSAMGKCNAHNCRVVQAESFAQSIGLYCDRAVLTDYITQLFNSENVSSEHTGLILSDLQVLNVLMPMIREGIIGFSDPFGNMCKKCCKTITGDLSRQLWQLVDCNTHL